MALDKASYIGNLNKAIPANTEPRSEGAGQIRAVKNALVNSFPEVKGEVIHDQDAINSVISNTQWVYGMTQQFFGDVADLPDSWVPCDGRQVTTGTGVIVTVPNLVGHSVIGALADGTDIGETGGSDTIDISPSLPSSTDGHSLVGTEIPEHDHDIHATSTTFDGGSSGDWCARSGNNGAESNFFDPETDNKQGVTAKSLGNGSTGDAISHSHDLTIGDTEYDNRSVFTKGVWIIYIGVTA